jgi:hypothetical protein
VLVLQRAPVRCDRLAEFGKSGCAQRHLQLRMRAVRDAERRACIRRD